jgi:osmotically-inducible protein OsmY
MPDTNLAGERRGSIVEMDGHESHVHSVPDGCHDALEFNVDRKLMEAVARALRTAGHSALRGLDIEISGGVVILWGRVPNYYQKQLAQEVVQRVDGVQGIANGLEVVCCR